MLFSIKKITDFKTPGLVPSKNRPVFGSFFFDCAARLVGSLFPEQGWKPGPLALGAKSLSHWTTRGVPALSFIWDGETPLTLPEVTLPSAQMTGGNTSPEGIAEMLGEGQGRWKHAVWEDGCADSRVGGRSLLLQPRT